jgi:ABC-type amino acid transport substrate-binding protein
VNFENLVPISRFTCRFSWVVFIFCIFTASQSTHASVESVSATSLALTQEEKDWLAAAPPITVVTRHGWAPIEFISEGGEYRGISIDYLRKIESMLGIRFQLSTSNLLTSEDTDVIYATKAINANKKSGF